MSSSSHHDEFDNDEIDNLYMLDGEGDPLKYNFDLIDSKDANSEHENEWNECASRTHFKDADRYTIVVGEVMGVQG